MTFKLKEEKRKTSFKKCKEASSHVEEDVPNFTAFGASYGEDEDEGKKALNVDSIYEWNAPSQCAKEKWRALQGEWVLEDVEDFLSGKDPCS